MILDYPVLFCYNWNCLGFTIRGFFYSQTIKYLVVKVPPLLIGKSPFVTLDKLLSRGGIFAFTSLELER